MTKLGTKLLETATAEVQQAAAYFTPTLLRNPAIVKA